MKKEIPGDVEAKEWETPITGEDYGPIFRVLNRQNIILVGHFGSGKTEIAVNLALGHRVLGHDVTLVDLDLVKPYFRSRLARGKLESQSVAVVVPEGDRFHADLPILMPQVKGALMGGRGREHRVVVDVGGHDLGARVMGSLAPLVDLEKTHTLFVVNTNRPFAETPQLIVEMVGRVEEASKLKINGLVANTHLMEYTDLAVIKEGLEAAKEVSTLTGIPLFFISSMTPLVKELKVVLRQEPELEYPILPMERYIVPPHARRLGQTRGPALVV